MLKNKQTPLLGNTADLVTMLEDQLVGCSSMLTSPYIGPIEFEIKEWQARLNHVLVILDKWLYCQKNWLYLEAIFASESIWQQV